MGIKSGIKRLVFNMSSGLADVLYRRPYSDPEAKKRMRSEETLLHLDLVITEFCTRRCRDCSNLMQYYQKPEHLPSDSIISDLEKLLECFRVEELKILGGEPFTNPEVLNAVLGHLAGKAGSRVDRINIITNGTVIPGDECIEAMKTDPKIEVTFSNYGTVSSRQDEFVELCKENGIRHTVIDGSFYWLDFGRPVKYLESWDFLERQYKHCYNRKNCNTLYRGGFYACPRQAHGIHLGLLPDVKDEYVDLYDPKYSTSDELKHAILGVVRRKKHVTACRFCINGKYIHVPRGIQKDQGNGTGL